jgi:hypothetical protein
VVRPLVPSWKPYQTRRPADEELQAWIGRSPAAWAVVTGAISGRITLDFDGAPGWQTMERLGLEPHRSTPSGGFHVDFDHPGWRVRTLNGKSKREMDARWPGLDIRADGGYVLFTGRTDRGEYLWRHDPKPHSLDILPMDLREYLGLARPPERTGATRDNHSTPSRHDRVAVERVVRMALDLADTHGRNNAGLWLACQLRDNRVKRLLWVSFAAVMCLTLIACANLTTLLLSRAAEREREFAIRRAMGAPGWQLVSQSLAESGGIALIGGSLALVLASAGIRTLGAAAAGYIPRMRYLRLDSMVVVVVFSVSLLCSLLCGIAPAMRAARLHPSDSFGDSSRVQPRLPCRGIAMQTMSVPLIFTTPSWNAYRNYQQYRPQQRALGCLFEVRPKDCCFILQIGSGE